MHEDYKKVCLAIFFNNTILNEQLIDLNKQQGKSSEANEKIADYQEYIAVKIENDEELTVGEYMFIGVCLNLVLTSLRGEVKRMTQTLAMYDKFFVPQLMGLQKTRDLEKIIEDFNQPIDGVNLNG